MRTGHLIRRVVFWKLAGITSTYVSGQKKVWALIPLHSTFDVLGPVYGTALAPEFRNKVLQLVTAFRR